MRVRALPARRIWLRTAVAMSGDKDGNGKRLTGDLQYTRQVPNFLKSMIMITFAHMRGALAAYLLQDGASVGCEVRYCESPWRGSS